MIMRIWICILFFSCGTFIFGQDYKAYKEMFRQDTARVERIFRDMQTEDSSTAGMKEALKELEKGYDGLLNKYYQTLITSIEKEEDIKTLRESQRSWIKFRDSEKKLVSALAMQEYEKSGGGTIWSIVKLSADTEITKRRLIDLFSLLMIGDLIGDD